VLFLSDIFPTGWMAARLRHPAGDVVAVFGCGPVGQFAIKSAYLSAPSAVIAIDRVPERLRMAPRSRRRETIDYEPSTVYEALQEMTGGRGRTRVIDAVGMEGHSRGRRWRTIVSSR
jgi:threonine dehydrogenase-like Zn-dependent dehydrogenase